MGGMGISMESYGLIYPSLNKNNNIISLSGLNIEIIDNSIFDPEEEKRKKKSKNKLKMLIENNNIIVD